MKKDYSPEDLIKKYVDGTASPEEKAIVESWHLQDIKESTYSPSKTKIELVHNSMRAKMLRSVTKRKTIALWPKIAYAAAAVLLLGVGVTFLILNLKPKPHQNIAQLKPGTFKNDAVAGNNAILTLGNGKKVALADLTSHNIAKIAGKQVHKSAGGGLVYSKVNPGTVGALVYNMLSVPRGGGKHEIKLSDGTLAVLDAGSSIRFPVAFAGSDRSVEITGQVYFEVVHNPAQPFSVKAGSQTIRDIGTKFNVNAFDGEIRTTLIEGSVKVNSLVLKPGQQAIQKGNGNLSIIDHVDEPEVIAWKNDMFMFGKNTSLETVMNQLSRWYDMDIVYQGQVKPYHFGGDMPRYSKLSDVLKILAYSGVQFSVDGKKIIVYQ